jgi:ABC-type branched-subunit amino acid transport system substrate-binding protein
MPLHHRLLGRLLDLRIGTRLMLAFGGVFIVMATMALFAILHMANMNERMSHITGGNNQQIAAVNVMIDSVSQRAIAIRNLTLRSDKDLKQQELQAIEEAGKAYAKAETDLQALIERYDASEAEKALFEAIKRANSVEGPKLRDEIAKTKEFQGVTGIITLNEQRDATKSAVVLEVKDGLFKYLETVNP